MENIQASRGNVRNEEKKRKHFHKNVGKTEKVFSTTKTVETTEKKPEIEILSGVKKQTAEKKVLNAKEKKKKADKNSSAKMKKMMSETSSKKSAGRPKGSKNKKSVQLQSVQPHIIKKSAGRPKGSLNKKTLSKQTDNVTSISIAPKTSTIASKPATIAQSFDIKNFIVEKCKNGDRNFIKLQNFMEKHSYLDIDSAMMIINTNVANKQKTGKNNVVKENFKITNLTKMNNYTRIIGKIGKYFHDYQDKKLIKAIISLWKIEGYNHNVMMTKLIHQKDKLRKCKTTKEYRSLLLTIYNYHSKNKLKIA